MGRKRLGEILLEKGLLTKEGLEEALQLQQVTQERLGRILIRLGLVPEKEITAALAEQLGVPEIHLFDEVDMSVIHGVVPKSLIVRYKVVPVKRQDNRLLLAMADPLDVLAIDDIQQVCKLEVEPAISPEGEIEQFIGQFYGLQELASQASQDPELSAAPAGTWEIKETIHDEALVIKLINTTLSQGIRLRASDIHVEPSMDRVRLRYRIDGLLREVMELPPGILPPLVSRIKIMANLDITEKRLPQDGRLQLHLNGKLVNLRVAVVPTLFGEKVVLRILDGATSLIPLDDIGFSAGTLKQYRQLITSTYGMILITGPTGSGKTTTLYATLDHINKPELNIMTIEDPVEYVLPGINQIRVRAKAGLDFAAGLRAILRQDPDVIMVGEIRDRETAEIAVRAAITGHLVFSTLHTADAAGAVTRLLDMGVEPYLVASSLHAVVAQRLVRRLCPHCQEPYRPEPGSSEAIYLEEMGFPLGELTRGTGCRHCEYTGYHGRLAILELLPMHRELRQLTMKRTASDELKRAAIASGMVPLQEDGIAKAFQKLTTVAEVMRVAYGAENT
ncbi:MAG TPA: Flp pilus assembly complex ATPase component TadA [Clostridia bacterium]|nr:Flp pilus assembly complex ATPase component TadA [Clostridia bacterium]